MREGVAFHESKRGDGAMNELSGKRMVSGRFLKLVAGGVSLLVLAVLAVLAVGFFADSPGVRHLHHTFAHLRNRHGFRLPRQVERLP